MSEIAYIGLGSNLGDRAAMIARAVQALGRTDGVTVKRHSPIVETAPVGGPAGQGNYLNAAVSIETTLSPHELLTRLHAIEDELGRVRTVKDGPRTIDLDLLLYGEQIVQGPELVVPHPRLHERLFVLAPLSAIAPAARHPVLGSTVEELYTRLLTTVPPLVPVPGRELNGLRALVTGSSSGIGRAIAEELARAGAAVIIHGRRNTLEPGFLAVDGPQPHRALRADLRHPVGRTDLIERAWDTWNGLDILINNAGADTLTGEAASWPFERKLDELLNVDLRATMHLSRAIGARMKQAGHGVIVNMGWDQAETGMAGDSGELFAAVKGAIMCFSRSLALSLAPQVRVHCLAPGWIKTAWGEGASEAWQQRVLHETPLQRWGTPQDVAAAARWLVSPQAAYLTGQTIRINGGAVRG